MLLRVQYEIQQLTETKDRIQYEIQQSIGTQAAQEEELVVRLAHFYVHGHEGQWQAQGQEARAGQPFGDGTVGS